MIKHGFLEFGETAQWHRVVEGLIRQCNFPDGIKILDVGGNVGAFKKLFKRSDYHVLDYPEDILEKARKNGCIAVKHDLNELPLKLKNDSFDLVLALEVFEHVFYPHSLLKEIRRVMRPGGGVRHTQSSQRAASVNSSQDTVQQVA